MSDLMTFGEKDYEILASALDAWELQPFADCMQSAILRQIAGDKSDMKMESEKAGREVKNRKQVTVILRAKVELARQAAQREAIERAV